MIRERKDVFLQTCCCYNNKAERRVITLVLCVRRTWPSVFVYSQLSGILKEHESQEALKEVAGNWGPQRAAPFCPPSAPTVAAKWTFGLCFPDLFLPKLYSNVYYEDFTTVTAVGRLFHRTRNEKQRWVIYQKHRGDSRKQIKLVLSKALRGKKKKKITRGRWGWER